MAHLLLFGFQNLFLEHLFFSLAIYLVLSHTAAGPLGTGGAVALNETMVLFAVRRSLPLLVADLAFKNLENSFHIVAVLCAFLVCTLILDKLFKGSLLVLDLPQIVLASLLHGEPASRSDHVGRSGRVVSEALVLHDLMARVVWEARRK